MRESFTYRSVGRAPGNRCPYPEPDRLIMPRFFKDDGVVNSDAIIKDLSVNYAQDVITI